LKSERPLYQRVADLLNQEAGLRKEDVFINLVETAKENWSSATAKHNTQRNAFLCNVK